MSVQASDELKRRAHADDARRQRLPVAEPARWPDHAEARRDRRGQGREGRRLAVRLPRPASRSTRSPSRQRQADDIAGGRPRRRRTRSTRRTLSNGESVQLTEDCYAGINAKAQLPRAPGRDGLRRGPARLQRRQADQPDDGARRWSATRTSCARRSSSASTTRTLSLSLGNTKDLERRQAASGRHRHLQPGRLGRLPAFLNTGQLPKTGAHGHVQPDARGDRSTTPTRRRSRPSSAGSSSAAGSTPPRGASTETHNPDGDDRQDRDRPLRRHRHRGHDEEGRQRQRRRTAHPLAAARTTSTRR